MGEDVEYTCSSLTKSSIRFLKSLPAHMRLNIGGKRILIVHGSSSSTEEYIKPDTPDERLERDSKNIGSRRDYFRPRPHTIHENSGQCRIHSPRKRGRSVRQSSRSAYAILTLEPFTSELLRVPYDLEAVTHEIRKKRLPEKLAQSLLLGSSPRRNPDTWRRKKKRK